MHGRVRIFIPSLVGGLTFAGQGDLASGDKTVQAFFSAHELGGIDIKELEGLLRAQAYLILRFEPREEAVPFQKYEATLLASTLSMDALACTFQLRAM